MLAENPLISYKEDESTDSLLEKGVEMLRAFFASMKPEKVLAVDQEFSIPVSEGKALLSGFMDLLVESETGVTVVEFKTAARKWSQGDADSTLQATTYALAAQNLFPGREVSIRFDIITKAKQPAFQQLHTKRGNWDEIRLINLITATQDAVEKSVFFPIQGYRCAGCGFASRCQMWTYEPVEAEAARV